MKPQQLIFVISLQTNELEIYGVRYYGQTDKNGVRFRYGRANLGLEMRDTKLVNWIGRISSERIEAQLQAVLGNDYLVLENFQLYQVIKTSEKLKAMIKQFKINRDLPF